MPKISSRESANFTVFFTLTVLKQFHNMMCPPNMQHFWAVSLYRARRYSFRETQDYCLSEKRNFGFVWMISCIPEINRLMQNCFLKNSKLIFLCVFFNNVFFFIVQSEILAGPMFSISVGETCTSLPAFFISVCIYFTLDFFWLKLPLPI